ncbi:hypothetical protein GCM10020000_31860 [Streptomyces olivoverticillatus]
MLPEDLVADVRAVKATGEWTSGALDQLTLAEFITGGGYDRHVRSVRLHYRRRRDQLVAALAEHAPPHPRHRHRRRAARRPRTAAGHRGGHPPGRRPAGPRPGGPGPLPPPGRIRPGRPPTA